MSTKLFPYAYVPPGFEIVIDLSSLAEQGIKGEIVPGSKGGIWNLWFNITLSDNPMTWDDEVQAITNIAVANEGSNASSAPRWQNFAGFTPSSLKVLTPSAER